MTRSRPSHSNDNPFAEQKNGAIVRLSAFNYRYDTDAELALLNELWPLVNLRKNLFLPTKIMTGYRKTRAGKTGRIYDTGLRLRVLPALGHLPLNKITAGMIDRTIDNWEDHYSPSVVKNSIAPLVRVLDEALRDDRLTVNPARNRARRSLNKPTYQLAGSLRTHAIPDLVTLRKIAEACAKVHQSYSDNVMLAALLAARGSVIAGLRVSNVDWTHRIVTIERQIYPGKGGLVTKQTTGRKGRFVPILDALEPVLVRLTTDRHPDEPLLRGPKSGVLTTASVRRATKWGRARREPRSAESDPPRAPPHGCDVVRRLGHPAPRAATDPRTSVDRNHQRLPAPRPPTPLRRRPTSEHVPRPTTPTGDPPPERPWTLTHNVHASPPEEAPCDPARIGHQEAA